jgi:Protein of unknown function (DUF3987)
MNQWLHSVRGNENNCNTTYYNSPPSTGLDGDPASVEHRAAEQPPAMQSRPDGQPDAFNTANPSDVFNARFTIDDVLEGAGYVASADGLFVRPGLVDDSIKAVVGADKVERAYFENPTLPYPKEQGYDAFSLFALLYHQGDKAAAMAQTDAELLHLNRRGQAEDNCCSVVEPFQSFPIHVLPAPLARYVTEGAKALRCDPAFIAVPLLASLAAAIGNSRVVRLKRSWTEPCILWCVTVGTSGFLKSPALDMAMRFLRRREAKALKRHEQLMEQYNRDKDKFDAALAYWKKHHCRDERPHEPTPPTRDRLLVSDATVEALAPLLREGSRGLFLVRDELAGFFGSFNQYKKSGGSDVSNWLEAHRAGLWVVDRKTGDQPTIFVPHASVSICGTIQPQILRRHLTNEFFENGLAARLFLTMPPVQTKSWSDDDIDDSLTQIVENMFDKLLDLKPSIDRDGEPVPADVNLSDAAKTVWVRFYNAHSEEQLEVGTELQPAWAKLEGGAARLALIVHCARWAADEKINQLEMDEKSLNAGIELARWFGHEAKRVYSSLSETLEERRSRELIELIRRRIDANGGEPVAVREIWRGCRLFKSHDDFLQALTQLTTSIPRLGRFIYPPGGPTGGRPSRCFELLPEVASSQNTETPKPKTSPGAVRNDGFGIPATIDCDGEDMVAKSCENPLQRAQNIAPTNPLVKAVRAAGGTLGIVSDLSCVSGHCGMPPGPTALAD